MALANHCRRGWLAWLLLSPADWNQACHDGSTQERLQMALKALAASALQAAACSLVLSTALALIPAGQLWLLLAATTGWLRVLPRGAEDPLRIPQADLGSMNRPDQSQ